MKDFNAIFNAVTRSSHKEASELEAIRALSDNGETYDSICRYFDEYNSVYVIYNNGTVARIIYNFDSDSYTEIESYLNYLQNDVGYSEDYILNNIAIFEVTSIKFYDATVIKDYTGEIDEDSLECVDVRLRSGQIFLNFEDANGRALEEFYEYDSLNKKVGSIFELSDNHEALSREVAYLKSYSSREYADKLLKFFEEKRLSSYISKKMSEDAHIMFDDKIGLAKYNILVSIRTYQNNMKFAYKIFARSGEDLTYHFSKLLNMKMSKNFEIYGSGFGMCRLFELQQAIKSRAGLAVEPVGITTKNSSRVLQPLNAKTFKHIGLS